MVTRWDTYVFHGCLEEEVCHGGRWVEYDDYAALQAENERLKAERVDLEKFRSVLEYAYMWGGNEVSSSLYDELSEMIDAHKGE